LDDIKPALGEDLKSTPVENYDLKHGISDENSESDIMEPDTKTPLLNMDQR